MMVSLPSATSRLTIAELEKEFARAKSEAAKAAQAANRLRIEVKTELAEVETEVLGCTGAVFFEHVVSGVTILSEENA